MRLPRNLLRWAALALFILFISFHILTSQSEDRARTKGQSPPLNPQSTKEAFLKLVDRPRIALDPKVEEIGKGQNWLQFHFEFSSDARHRVPGILLEPAGDRGRRPAAIVLHGTGGRKEKELPLLKDLTAKGFIAVAIDAPYHGERAPRGKADYAQAIMRAYFTGNEHPFLYDTVWDVMRLVDFLETRPDVDPARIGLIGFSKGGIEAALTAAIDPRISVTAPCIGVQSFRWSLQNSAWKPLFETLTAEVNGAGKETSFPEMDPEFLRKLFERVVPGIDSQFDGPAVLPLIAPRPLFIITSDSDPLTPLASVMECVAAARSAYADSRAEDKFVLRVQKNTGHWVTPESRRAAVEWFVRWLRP
ncbi:MAG TPA: alpha/beta fold hydrolase [Acidobacteriota bacterium]